MRPSFGWHWVEAEAVHTAGIWRVYDGQAFDAGRHFTAAEQREREAAYDEALRVVESELRRTPNTRVDRQALQTRVMEAFARFSAKALDLDASMIDLLTQDFLPVGTTLARWARDFDPGLPMDGIVQACRNAWTACGLQPLLGERVQITPSILAYSLIYPYSDNQLDDECIPNETKLRFSQRFRRRLSGEKFTAGRQTERFIWQLIELIEEQYPRERFPQVYECLLSIHRAQEQSIFQIRNRDGYSETETLLLSCRKGGSSVLADACLAHPFLNEEQSRFAFEWGVLLQLGDDVQDVREDLRRGSITMFSHAAATGTPLDGLTTRLLQFAAHVGNSMDFLSHGSAVVKRLLKTSWRSLIVRAVADSSEFFSPAFVERAERHSPFRFQFLRERHEQIARKNRLYGMMFEAFVEEDEGSGECEALQEQPSVNERDRDYRSP